MLPPSEGLHSRSLALSRLFATATSSAAANRGVALAARVKRRAQREWFIQRIALAATAVGSTVTFDVDSDTYLSPLMQIDIRPGTNSRVRLGPKVKIGKVRLVLQGGDLSVGPRSDVRDGAIVVVGGSLRLAGRNIVSWNACLFCDEAIDLGEGVIVGQYTTIVDTTHFFRPGSWINDNVYTRPVRIHDNVWIGAAATITPGVTIGDHVVVGANAVVTRNVPPWHLASGVPAESRPLPSSLTKS